MKSTLACDVVLKHLYSSLNDTLIEPELPILLDWIYILIGGILFSSDHHLKRSDLFDV